MTTLFLDLETYCDVPIAHGTHAYAEQAEVLLIAQAVDDEPVEVWDCTDGNRAAYLVRLQTAIDAADKIVIHNSAFDRTVLRWQGVNMPVEKVHDTMVQALAHSLPAALGQLCDVLEVPTNKSKDKDGKRLIHLFTKPLGRNRTLDRATFDTHPSDWVMFVEYARLDVEAMREVYNRLPIWNYRGRELEMWRLDQTINDRGIAVDRELAEVAQRAAQRASKRLAQEATALTGGAVTNTSQRGKTLDHLRQLGLETEDLRGGTIDKLLLRDDLTSDIRALLENRAQASATSPAKYRTLSNAASSDGRLRGALQFCGASRTGRWGGRLFQPQNLPRPTMKHAEIEAGIAAMKADVEDMLFDNVVELCTSAVRGCLVAAPGKKLVIADLSNIEGRMLAFLAGEQWKLDAFADFDRGIGPDLYKLAYARSFNKKPEDVTPDERQIGKVMELACFGPDTKVLTDKGPVAIKDIKHEHRLWDGHEWVTHAGLIDRGNRKVVCLDGVEVTPDHRVLCGGTWLPAKTVASSPNCLDLALATGLESLKSLVLTSGLWAEFCGSECGALAAPHPTPSTSPTFDGARPLGATIVLRKPRANGEKTGTATRRSAPTARTDGGCVTASRLATIGATTRTTRAFRTTAGAASGCTSRGEPTGPLSSPTSSLLKAGTSPSLNSTASTLTEATNPETCASSQSGQTATTSAQFETFSADLMRWKNVYDIALAGPRNRFTILTDSGALVVHNCGYQGGSGAFAKMAGLYGIELPDWRVKELVEAWRKAHSATKGFWKLTEEAARLALATPGKAYTAGKLVFRVDGTWLRVGLPSSRYLCYPNAAIDDAGKLSYEGTDQYTRKWTRLDTYGGKLVENATQAAARDILTCGMRHAEAAGYPIVLHVHDELLCETPDSPEYTHEGLAKLMSTGPQWAVGLPLAAAGFETKRYRKG